MIHLIRFPSKIPLILILFSGISLLSFAQTITISDKTSLKPVENAIIYDSLQTISVITSKEGKADITPFLNSKKIIIQHSAYRTKVIALNELKEAGYQIYLSAKTVLLDEIVVSAGKFEEKETDIPQQVDVISKSEIEWSNQQTSADMLSNTGNILVQKSQMGGGSPIIRGFEANKVLIVIDGIRMNNAIYRGGHLQNSITIDNTMLDKIEIIYGPGSVVYGSDALGGVMYFETKKPLLVEGNKGNIGNKGNRGNIDLATNFFERLASANRESTTHLDFNFGFKKIGFLTGFTYSDYSDLRQGNRRKNQYGDIWKRKYYVKNISGSDSMIKNDDVNIQRFSGYDQFSMLQNILFRQNDNITHIINFQYSNSSNIPRYDRLTEYDPQGKLKYAEWYYGPQKRILGAYHLELKNKIYHKDSKAPGNTKNILKKGFYDNAKLVAAYQNIEESRHKRKFGATERKSQTENVNVLSLNIDMEKEITGQHEFRYGAEVTHNSVHSSAFFKDIFSGITRLADTRYPDGGSTMQTMAAFATHAWEMNEKVILREGIRYSSIRLNSKFNDTTFFPFPFKETSQQSGAFNGSLGLVLLPGKGWRFSMLGSTGFRAPNVDDMGKIFDSQPGTVIVPNPDLKPEYTYNAETGITKVIKEKIKIKTTGYYTFLTNAINTQSFQFNGNDSIVYDGQMSKVLSNVNSKKAYIYGFSGNFSADISNVFSLVSTINYTFGRIKTDSALYPLGHIPPLFGKTSVFFKINKFKAEFFVNYNGRKSVDDYSISGEDNFQYATPDGMPAWYTLNLRAAYQVNKHLQFQAALENILDVNYRVFGSGISSAGRNFIFTLRGGF